jgi:hypothetical protein
VSRLRTWQVARWCASALHLAGNLEVEKRLRNLSGLVLAELFGAEGGDRLSTCDTC